MDTVGGATLERSYGVLRPGGRSVTLVTPLAEETAKRYGVEAMFFIVRPDRVQLAHLAQLVDDGNLRPVVAQTFPLSQARRANERRSRTRTWQDGACHPQAGSRREIARIRPAAYRR
jgi:NADPH:quinone reductase-like Zn-dependent oxidoreductase